ncbi:MAG TPA: histidine kinase dimerization/phosphoacceptor domain -containing protein [Nitrospiraceae bacterium]|nr:histidine kinase dimerization/phosphoacceptor domain -containing protein [Nitrospiraceae bacterium]
METSNYRARSLPGAAWARPGSQPVIDLDDADPLAQAIVDTIRDPLLVLDQRLRVVTANRAFRQTFRMNRQDIQGRPVYGLGERQWDIPELRSLLEDVVPQHTVMEDYEVERDFLIIGRRSMLLNAREVLDQRNSRNLILLTFEDVTDRRAAESEISKLLQQKQTLLHEMRHRVANSLQIMAGILLLKARTVQSEETRLHLRDAHQRIMSVAAVQQLLASNHGEPVEIGPYLSRLCETLAASMTDESRPISLKVQVEGGAALSAEVESIGLIVTELVINAFKHAFVDARAAGLIVVAYEATETSWRLAVCDNGIGAPEGYLKLDKTPSGLGTIIIEALAKQLDARVEVVRKPKGTTASITHGVSDPAWPPLIGSASLPSSGGRRLPKSNGGSVTAV